MSLPAVYRRRVQHDLAGAFDWYTLQRLQLGEESLAAVQSTLRAIEQYPEMFAADHAGR